MKRPGKLLFSLSILFCIATGPLRAQVLGIPGANHSELDWDEIRTSHFILTYHTGLDSIVRVAAPIAEEVYRVVTTNLETPLPKPIRIYFANDDEIRNAFAFDDDYIFIWMRGILDDNLYSLRAGGTSKWLRSVITHEFTHIVIARATHTWINSFFPLPSVPRWFNEGMARYMEPDGWTSDLDLPLREAAMSGKLNLGWEDYLAGHMIYEGGQSLVRYIAATYGDTALVKILKHREPGLFQYDFDKSVKVATKHSLEEIGQEWHKILTVYYNTQYGQKEDVIDIARKIPTGLAIVMAARLSPDGKRIAVIGKREIEDPPMLYLLKNDTSGNAELISREPGIEPALSWTPDGKSVVFSKLRFGEHTSLVYDLYRCQISNGDLDRLSSDVRAEYPDVSPDGKQIVAAQFDLSGSDLITMSIDGGNLRKLTHFNDVNVDVYAPRWSPDGKSVAFSIFAKNGQRDNAIIDVASGEIKYITNDSINDRYPIWSPKESKLAYLSYKNGLPNIYIAESGGEGWKSGHTQLTDVASNVLPWDWANSDSLLITSFASRNSVQLYWLGAKRMPTVVYKELGPTAFSEAKYTSWRSVRWPLITRTQDSLPPVAIAGPFGHNSLLNISPLVVLPLISGDRAQNSNEGGLQYGLTGILTDDLHKHTLDLTAMYGAASHTFNYAIEYANNQLPPTIVLGASDFLNFKGRIEDVIYFERSQSYHLGFNFGFHPSNSLEIMHDLFIGGAYTKLTPWNPQDFFSVAPERTPIAVTLPTISLAYAYLSPFVTMGVIGAHADTKLKSDLTFTRLRAFFNWSFPLDEQAHSQFVIQGRGVIQDGAEIPQDFVGFSKYDNFDGGFSLSDMHERDRLRGIRRYVYGNRLIRASAELRSPDNLFHNLVPAIGTPQLVEFFDIGTTWYANAPTNNPNVLTQTLGQQHWMKSAGIELRSGIGGAFSFSGGVAWELIDNPPPDWYFRFNSEF